MRSISIEKSSHRTLFSQLVFMLKRLLFQSDGAAEAARKGDVFHWRAQLANEKHSF